MRQRLKCIFFSLFMLFLICLPFMAGLLCILTDFDYKLLGDSITFLYICIFTILFIGCIFTS